MPFAGSTFVSSLALVIMPEKKCLFKLGGASITACSEGSSGNNDFQILILNSAHVH